VCRAKRKGSDVTFTIRKENGILKITVEAFDPQIIAILETAEFGFKSRIHGWVLGPG